MFRLLFAFMLIICSLSHVAHAADRPGLSPGLFAKPGYTCTTNYYVSTTGSDFTGNGTLENPWGTIGGANDNASLTGGSCVNVEPGTYKIGNSNYYLNHGGTKNNATGYVVYRCMEFNSCTLQQTAYNGGGIINLAASYLWFDDIDLDGNETGCTVSGNVEPCTGDDGINILAANNAVFQHVTNVYVHGVGGNGLEVSNGGDCGWIVHNLLKNNASVNPAEDSGLSIYQPHPVSGVTSCGGPDSFHFHVQWNASYDNIEGPTIQPSQHTDGDGFIMDTWQANSYPYSGLVADNVASGNGGFCIGEDNSNNITFANNTCYNNFQDKLNPGTFRAEIWIAGGTNNRIINNIAWAVVGSGILADNISGIVFGNASDNTWTNNIFNGPNPYDYTGVNPITCTANLCMTNPDWKKPLANNFDLNSGSPAIGYGLSQPYLPSSDLDAGACYHSFTGGCPPVLSE